MTLPRWSDTQIINQLQSGNRWSGSVISYAYPTASVGIDTSDGEGRGFVALDTAQRRSADLALQLWDDLVTPSLSRVYFGLSDIEFGMTNTGIDYAHAYFPLVGSVWFNYEETELASPVVGDYGFSTYVHEIGHALGLDHAGDYNGYGNWSPLYFEDSTVYSIMSYFGPDHQDGEGRVGWGNWTDGLGTTYSPQTPMLNDVMAIQAIYGADLTTRFGNTVYGFTSNIRGDDLDRIYDFTVNQNPILCIYDAGGVDTINLSGWRSDSFVDLSPGALSSCNGMTNNISIARNTVIENLTTGSGNDMLVGNDASNILRAGEGNDVLVGSRGDNELDGGLGNDTARYQGEASSYRLTYSGGALKVEDLAVGSRSIDTLFNIEQLEFAGWRGSIQAKAASFGTQSLSLSGSFAQYQVTGNAAGSVVLDLIEGRDGVQLITDYERLRFSDFRVALDSGGSENAGMAYRLYKAAFDRTPDLGGVGYWISRFDNGLSIQSAAQAFIYSDEFKSLYGENPNTPDFVGLLYHHVMHRPAEGEGFNYWVNALSPQGGWTRADVLAYFSESAENLEQTAELVANGIQYVEFTA